MDVKRTEWTMQKMDTLALTENGRLAYHVVLSNLQNISQLPGMTSKAQVNKNTNFNIRKSIFLIARNVDLVLKSTYNNAKALLKPADITILKSNIKKLKTHTEYAPHWVILLVSLSLGFGTMIGWKRIVVTIGEKIGKTHLTYAQGASAELIAASTIGVSTWFGLPVSTTHVLSSGVAGAMVAGEGRQNLRMATIKNILAAWVFTLPVTILLSGGLFLLFRLVL